MTDRTESISSQPPVYANADEHARETPPSFPSATDLPEYYAPPLASEAVNRDEKTPAGPRAAPDNASLLPGYTPTKFGKYGRYKDEEEYLEALRDWADDRQYTSLKDDKGRETTLEGFYGAKTMHDYEVQERPEFRWRRRSSANRWSMSAGVDDNAAESSAAGERPQAGRRRSSIANWLKRKKADTDVEAIIE